MLIFSSMKISANSMLAFFACKWVLAVEESRELHKKQVTKSGTSDLKVQWWEGSWDFSNITRGRKCRGAVALLLFNPVPPPFRDKNQLTTVLCWGHWSPLMLRKGDLLKLAWFDLLQKKKQNKRTGFLVFSTGNYSIKLGYHIKVQCMCVHVYKYTSMYIHAHMSHTPTPHSLEYACTHTASCERSL